MARPRKSAQEKRDFIVSFRCNASEMSRLSAQADKAQQPVNAFARASALRGKVSIVQEQRLDFETRHQLRSIGNNLNQIARALNSSRDVDPQQVNTALEELNSFFTKALPDGSAHRW